MWWRLPQARLQVDCLPALLTGRNCRGVVVHAEEAAHDIACTLQIAYEYIQVDDATLGVAMHDLQLHLAVSQPTLVLLRIDTAGAEDTAIGANPSSGKVHRLEIHVRARRPHLPRLCLDAQKGGLALGAPRNPHQRVPSLLVEVESLSEQVGEVRITCRSHRRWGRCRAGGPACRGAGRRACGWARCRARLRLQRRVIGRSGTARLRPGRIDCGTGPVVVRRKLLHDHLEDRAVPVERLHQI
mmetsp:Transcript_37603/g.105659  ORF Transcript_37603/g.105659 Transcript_37603/m.105659 type:complete len:242 (+) Transcript_37603:50-775(+)